MPREEVTPEEAERILREQHGDTRPAKPQREVTKEEAKRIIKDDK